MSVRPKTYGVTLAIKAAGSASKLADDLGVSRQRVHQWYRVPAEMVRAVEKVTGVPAADLRPDLYKGMK